MQFSLRALLLAVLLVAVAGVSIRLGVARTRHNIETTRSTYAARLVAQMCVEHMKANGQAWPQEWEELRDDFDPCLRRSGQLWSFDDLEQRVGVDWGVEPTQFRRETDDEQVIWVANEPSQKFYGTSPNQIVSRYLKSAGLGGL